MLKCWLLITVHEILVLCFEEKYEQININKWDFSVGGDGILIKWNNYIYTWKNINVFSTLTYFNFKLI